MKKARRWIARKRRLGRVSVRGIVQRNDTGRPEVQFGRPVKPGEEGHEWFVTKLALHFLGCPFQRRIKVGHAEPDLVLTKDGRRCFVEVDYSGKMAAKQMQAKYRRYAGQDGFILIVALTDGRMERLRAGAELVADRALFTTFNRLDAGQPWIDFAGNALTI